MIKKTENSYQTFIYDFLKYDVWVHCPGCSKKAIIKTNDFSFRDNNHEEIKLVCTGCGYSKKLSEKPSAILSTSGTKPLKGRVYAIGGAIDPFFYLPLWLTISCENNILWAYNREHLTFLHTHVEAKLRERSGPDHSNKSLGSRLPGWMTSEKNRQKVLKKISELESK